MFKKTLLLFLIISLNSAFASVIPEGKCAIITGASKSQKDVLKALKKYSDIVDPIAVKSNNGYYAFSLGIYEKSNSKSVLNEFKGKGLIPKDSYCGNVKRFIAILYPNKDYTALTDKPSNQSKTTELADNSSSTSLEVSNLRIENQNLKLRISSLLNEVNKLKNNAIDSDSTNLLKISNLSTENKNLKLRVNSLLNEVNKLKNNNVDNNSVLRTEIQNLKKTIDKFENENEKLDKENKNLKSQIRIFNEKLSKMNIETTDNLNFKKNKKIDSSEEVLFFDDGF